MQASVRRYSRRVGSHVGCASCVLRGKQPEKKRWCPKLDEITRGAARPTLTQSRLDYHVSLDEYVSTQELTKGAKYGAVTSRRFRLCDKTGRPGVAQRLPLRASAVMADATRSE